MSTTHPDRRITRTERQTVYQAVRRATMPPRPPRVAQFDLVGRAGLAGVPTAIVGEILDDLVQTDHCWRYDYHERPEAVPAAQRPRAWLTINDDAWLRDWLVHEAETDAPDETLIGALNQQRARLAEVDDV